MKLSCSAYQAGSSYAQKILSGHNTQNYGATSSTATTTTDSSHGITMPTWTVEEVEGKVSPNETEFGAESSTTCGYQQDGNVSGGGGVESGGASRGESSRRTSSSLSHHSDVQPDQKGNQSDSTSISKAPATSSCSPSDSPAHRSKSNQRWMKLRTTVQLSGAIQTIQQKKAPLKREDSFLKRFSTRQIPEAQETFEIGDDGEPGGGEGGWSKKGRKKRRSLPRTVVNPDCNFYFYWLMLLTFCVLYNLWTLIVRQSFPELQENARLFWILADVFSDVVFLLDIAVQFRTGYLEQGLMVYQTRKLANHYVGSKHFYLDIFSLVPTDLVQFYLGANPMVRCPRFLKIYRVYNYYYMVESRTVYPNVLRVVNLIHILLLLAHWFGCFYYLISQAEGFDGDWGYPDPSKNIAFAPLTRKYLGSLYWSTLTLTTIGDLPQPHSNWQNESYLELSYAARLRERSKKTRLYYFKTNTGYLFTIVSYLIGVFIFATIVGQVGNVITNRNANRLEFERLLDGAKMYMRHHKVPRDMQRRVLRWYDYSWSRGRIQGGGDINTALGLLPDKLKTELALHVNLSVLKKVTIFQECQPEFLHDLVLKMKAYIFTPGDLICRKGEVAREMFIIADGILEVISETGKVLTTMQAGDFFGEIGILNLDGLNKRTADVRSVGYSELFSLSREDVLAAMKDYPEAQEILQTLGRKRLMEARKASGPVVKKPGPGGGPPGAPGGGAAGVVVGVVPNLEPKKSSPVHATALSHSGSINSHKELMDGCGGGGSVGPVDTTTGKRIVEKLRSDVKGLRNAIRRSRKSNSSKEDSSEPESSGKAEGEGLVRGDSNKGSSTSSIPRGVLKRMHNVATSGDDKEKAAASVGDPSIIKSSLSPSSAAPSVASAFKKSSLASAVKRVQMGRSPSIAKKKAEEPPEIIGAGLPLIQRLRLLRQKEEREKKQQDEREALMKTLIPSNLSLASPSGSPTVSPIMHTKACVEAPPKPKTMDPATALAQVVERTRVERASISSNDSSTISSPPSTSLQLLGTFSPKSSLLIGEAAAAAASKATAEPIPMAAAGGFFPPLWTPSPPRGPRSSASDPIASVSDPIASVSEPIASSSTSCPPHYPCHHYHSASVSSSDRPSALQLRQQHAAKNYGSVDDLSPEFSRLPFIKKLKILNERQKIAEILLSKSANSVLTRSTSEGSNETPVVGGEVEVTLHSVQLGRRTQSNKEKLEIEGGAGDEEDGGLSPYFSSKGSFQKSPPSEEEAAGRTATTTKTSSEDSNATVCLRDGGREDGVRGGSSSVSGGGGGHKSKVRKRRKVKKPCEEGRSEDSSPSPPLSPDGESNETPERRNLKSILKKLAETKELGGDGGSREEVSLLKAPTVEGYAARHRKFAKNVTFRRQAVTVVSPEGPTSPTPASPTSLPSSTFATSPISASSRREPPPPADGGSLRRDQPADLSVILPLLQSLSSENMRILSSLLVEGGGGFAAPLPHEGLRLAQDEGSSGVKTIIYEKLDEIQRKFQARFDLLEEELRRRDEFISVLERRYCEESAGGGARRKGGGGRNHVVEDTLGIEGDVEMEEDLDEDDEDEVEEYRRVGRITNQSSYLFSRGDSIDTVISAQDFDDEVFERAEVEYAEVLSEAGSVAPGEEDGGGGEEGRGRRDGRPSNHTASSSAWGREAIEMRDLGPAPWQLEFHRDRDSLPPPNGGRRGDAVAVEIGNTSTETDDGSSEDGDGREEVVLKERQVSLEEDEEEGNNESESGGGEEEEEEEEGSGDINHKNWEVQMLVKEMEKQEEKRKTTEEVVGEVRKLENDIEALKVAFHEGNLSPSELDVLDSVLETKTRRMKVLFKALSVDSSVPGGQKKSSGEDGGEGQEEWRKRRSYEDFFLRRGSGGSLTQQSVLMGGVGGSAGMSRATGFPPRSLFSPFSCERQGKLSPGETLDLQRLLLPRKHGGLGGGGMRRQASLCETSLGGRKRSGESSRRRESAGTVASFGKEAPAVPSAKKSFFSRFGLVRQLTGRRKGLAEDSKRDQVEEEEISDGAAREGSSSTGLLPRGASPPEVSQPPGEDSSRGETVTTESTTILVLNTSSTTTTTIGGGGGGSVGGGGVSGGSGVLTIPSFPSSRHSPSHEPPNPEPVSIPGESQPLLKK